MGDIGRTMERIITLTTDFGLKDPYQGAMKGAVLSINPKAKLIDITHLVSPENILEGALILLDAYEFFPEGAIHVGVVDPGVGGARKPVLIETKRHFFIGPDNGLFSLIAEREEVRRVVHLTNQKFFRKDISATFHGRDIFGPVAAHLSLGVDPALFGEEIKSLQSTEMPQPEKESGQIVGEVIYVDSFGNLLTNIKGSDISPSDGNIEVSIKGVTLKGIRNTYSSAEKGAVIALISSSKHLEIAVNSGMASKIIGAEVGERVLVKVSR